MLNPYYVPGTVPIILYYFYYLNLTTDNMIFPILQKYNLMSRELSQLD